MKKRIVLSLTLVLMAALLMSTVSLAAQAAVPRIINTRTYAAKLDLAPSLIAEFNEEGQAESYAEYTATLRPSNVIVYVNSELDAVDKTSNEKIGKLESVYSSLKSSAILTVVYISDTETADAFSAWLTQEDVYDIAVMSSDAALVKKVRTANESIRGIVDYSRISGELALKDTVSESNASYAHIVALSKEQATAEAVYYLHARFKAVWAFCEIDDEFDLYSAVSSGVYGIITNADTRQLYKLYDKYESNSLARPFYNIGHRGLPVSMPENTLECCLAAYNGGATAVEIDMKVSTDDQIFIMHDGDLSVSTNGPKTDPENMTLEQLRKYKVTKNSNGQEVGEPCDIPTLDDIFKAFKNIDDCVVICEIKTVKTKIIDLFAAKLKEYDMYDKVVVIAFSQSMLMSMKEKVPEIPTAYLTGCTQSTAVDDLKNLCKYNTIVNAMNDHDYFEERNLKNRGYLIYSWTYNSLAEVKGAAVDGTLGITNNFADTLFFCQKRIIPSDEYRISDTADLSSAKFKAEVETFGREKQEKELSVFAYRKTDDKAEVILVSEADGYIIYSEPVTVTLVSESSGNGGDSSDNDKKPEDGNGGQNENTGGNSGCGGSLLGANTAFAAVILTAAVVALLTKRKGVYKEL